MSDKPEALRLADAIWPWHKGITCNLSLAAAELRRLHAEVERLRADAERYRLLRDAHPADGKLWIAMGAPHSPAGISCWRHEQADAAIDAAIKEGRR